MDADLALTVILAAVVVLLVVAQFTRIPYPILLVLVLGGLLHPAAGTAPPRLQYRCSSTPTPTSPTGS